MIFSTHKNPGDQPTITPAEIKERLQYQFLDILAGIRADEDPVTTACSQNCYLFTDSCDLLNQEQAFISNYQLLLIVNNSGSQTIDCLNKFRKKFDTGILINLHCYSLAEATRFFHECGASFEYITYNDKMLYGMIYTTLRLQLL